MKVHPEVLRNFNSIYVKNPHKTLIHNLLFFNKKIPASLEYKINEIVQQCREIYTCLEPLVEMGFTFNMWLVGGSVRDLLLGKENEIKDLDIVISFFENKTKMLNSDQFIKKSGFNFTMPSASHFISRNGSDKPFEHWKTSFYKLPKYKREQAVRSAFFYDILGCAIAQKLNILEVYKPKLSSSAPINENYMDTRLDGVIKLKEEHWSYPVDILITSYSVENFIDCFDFGICKAGFDFVRAHELKLQRYDPPQNAQDILHRAFLTKHFLDDVYEKKISMSVGEHMLLGHLRHSCENHLPRLEEKYKWPVKINIETSASYNEDSLGKQDNILVKYLDSFFLQKKLNENLHLKETAIQKKSNKI